MDILNPDISKTLRNIIDSLEEIKALSLKKNKIFLDANEAAEFTGYKKNTLYSMCSKGEIPHYKLNEGRLFFSVEEIENWILDKKHRRKTNFQIDADAQTWLNNKKITKR